MMEKLATKIRIKSHLPEDMGIKHYLLIIKKEKMAHFRTKL